MTQTSSPASPANVPGTATEHPSALHSSLGFLLAAAVDEIFPGREFYIEHSFLGGYFCHFGAANRTDGADLVALTETLRRYTADATPLELLELDRQELQDRFSARGRKDKLEILRRLEGDRIPAARFGSYLDYRLEPMITDLTRLGKFGLDPYDHGIVLRFPGLLPPYEVPPFRDSPKLYQIIQQRQKWGRALHINNLRQLNLLLDRSDFRETLMVAEGLHEKTVAEIADAIAARPDQRVIFVSGPSASGKTTFTKRLAIQLKVLGFDTLVISMDNYFRDRSDLTLGPDGVHDFESLEGVDATRMIRDLTALLDGTQVARRSYSFREGRGANTGGFLQISPTAFLLVEGIHGLNPLFTEELGRHNLQRIYVSAITQLNIDNEHRVSSSDSRLLRRMVRDRQFRGYNAEETILRWPTVRMGEERHIFAYQEAADLMFNSSLVYELAALREPAEMALREVPADSPAGDEAGRLLTFLSFVHPIDADAVPRNSILREFLGGSAFDY